jgi:hypothetical protein
MDVVSAGVGLDDADLGVGVNGEPDQDDRITANNTSSSNSPRFSPFMGPLPLAAAFVPKWEGTFTT